MELDCVGGTHCAGPQPVGFGIANKLRFAQIELQVPLQLLADVCRQADVHGPIHNFRIRHCESARADAVEKIQHMVHTPLSPACVIGQHFLIFTQ